MSVTSLFAAFADLSAAEPRRPNVLFLFTDDQRADTIAALGNEHIKTPHLDELVRSGFVFRNAYCLGSDQGAVCFPSRNMLLSGRVYFRHELQIGRRRYASAERPNFPASMKAAGYETYHHGKRGNTALEIHKVFDHSKYLKDEAARTSGRPGKPIVDDAIEFLGNRDASRPFFMFLAFATPHDPRVASKELMHEYDRENIPLPANYMPLHPFDNGWMTGRDERLAAWPRTKDEIQGHLHDYYAVITGIDRQIGRLLQTLKESGQYDDTLIIFSSDHGLAIGSHGLMGKQSVYEHSMKPPLIFAGPGIPNGETDALVYLHDIYPTVCDLVGTEIPDGLDGRSLAPVISGEAASVRDSIFLAYENVQRAVRDERWKLIRYPHINKTQLFDLKTDPHELHNLADDPQQSQRIEQMLALMKNWQQRVGDDAPLTSEQPRDPAFVPPAVEENTTHRR
ncbi:MAG: sulfatase-like hydrolase/transferase [Planctomycetaceae bacterium]